MPIASWREKGSIVVAAFSLTLLAALGASLWFLGARDHSRTVNAASGTQLSKEGPPLASPVNPATNGQSSSDQGKAMYQRRLATAQKWEAAINQYVQSVPASVTDIGALADSLSKPQAAFEYVRDRIALEPYPGAMKGAGGTLITSGGNDLDRSLLLSALLSHQGIHAQIAHGQLTLAQAQSLFQQIGTRPGATELIENSIKSSSNSQNPAAQKITAFTADNRQRFEKLIEQNYLLLNSSIKAANIAVGSDGTAAQIKILQNHYWVEAVIDGKTVDLDPSFSGADWAKRFTAVAETFSPNSLDSTRVQQMTLRLVADYLRGGKISSQNVLTADFNAIDLWGKNIRLAVLPNDSKSVPNEFHAKLMVGGVTAAEKTFQLRAIGSKQNPPQSAAGLFGALGGALGGSTGNGNAGAPAGAVLARLYFEAETRGPQLSPSVSRRVILDRLTSNSSNPQIDPSMAKDDIAASLIEQVWDGVIGFGPVRPVYLAKATAAWIGSLEALDNQLISAQNSRQKLNPSDLPGPILSPELLTFFLESGEAENDIQKQFAPRARAYYERPRLAFFHHGFAISDWSNLSKLPSYREGIDLVNSPFAFVGGVRDKASLAMRWGAADTALELRFSLTNNHTFNTLRLIAAAKAQQVPVRAIGPDQKSMLNSISVPPSIKSVLESELADNNALVVPIALVSMQHTHSYGWWSVDRRTGYAIGKMELGGAQDLSEYTNLQQSIPDWSHTAANLFGNFLKCYFGAASSVLATGSGGSTASCLSSACCDALGDVLGMETESAMAIAALSGEEKELNQLEAWTESLENYDAGMIASNAASHAPDPFCGSN